MKILVISQYFDPDITAAANRISESVDILCKAGHEVSVISATPHKSHIKDFVEFDKALAANVIRVSLESEVSGGSANGLIKQYLLFSIGALRKVFSNIKRISPDVVWVSSPPLPITFVSLVIKLIYRVPIVLDVRDIWPESAVNIGKLKRGSILEKLGLLLEKLSYYHADEITCVSSNMKAFIASKTSTNITTIYNSVLADGFYNQEINSGNPDIFSYAGNIGHAQDLELVVQSFAKARESKIMSNAMLHIIGDGALLDEIKSLVLKLGIEKSVQFFGAVPKPKAIEMMSSAGCLLLPLKDAPAFRITVPSKVFDYMALGRPIITNIGGEGASIISRCKANEIVPPSNLIELSSAMVKIRESWDKRIEEAIENSEIIINEFTREQEVLKLESILLKASRSKNK